VIAVVQQREATVGDAGRQLARLRLRYPEISSGVEDQGGAPHSCGDAQDVIRAKTSRKLTTLSIEVVARCRSLNACQSSGVPSGSIWAGEDLAEALVVSTPPHSHNVQVNGRLFAFLPGAGSSQPPLPIGAGQDKVRYSFRVPRRVGNGHRATLRYPQQRESVDSDRIHYQLEVIDPCPKLNSFTSQS